MECNVDMYLNFVGMGMGTGQPATLSPLIHPIQTLVTRTAQRAFPGHQVAAGQAGEAQSSDGLQTEEVGVDQEHQEQDVPQNHAQGGL